MEEKDSLFSLLIDPAAKVHLMETARWARFLAFVGFAFIFFLVLVGVYSSLTISRYEDMFNGYPGQRSFMEGLGVGMAITYVILALVSFFPFLFILRFATGMQHALSSNDQASLNSSFQNLKIYFRYLGIIFIICLVVMALSFLVEILGRSI